MKCPKCGYLGFEARRALSQLRIRLFADLAGIASAPDLPLRRDSQAMNPLDDLSLVDAAMVRPPPVRMSDAGPDLDRIFGAPEPAPPASPASSGRRAELPLFGPPIPDDEPLITRASPPRQPLAVRRATPDAPKARVEPPLRAPTLDLAIDLDDVQPAQTAALTPVSRERRNPWSAPERHAADAVAAAAGPPRPTPPSAPDCSRSSSIC